MATKSDHPSTKPVFVKLTPSMTREQKVQSLVDAMEKSGVTIHSSEIRGGKGGSA
jgi:hypothetical protein